MNVERMDVLRPADEIPILLYSEEYLQIVLTTVLSDERRLYYEMKQTEDRNMDTPRNRRHVIINNVSDNLTPQIGERVLQSGK